MRAKRLLLWLPALAYMGLVYFLSSLSNPPTPLHFPHADKVAHLIEYAVLAALLFLPGSRPWTVLCLTGFYAALDEVHQSFVAGRDASPWDWAADVAGVLMVLGLHALWKRHRS
jgi:VanZ family protein